MKVMWDHPEADTSIIFAASCLDEVLQLHIIPVLGRCDELNSFSIKWEDFDVVVGHWMLKTVCVSSKV